MAKGKGSGGVTSAAMKAVGRNMARANLQKGSPKVPSPFASGGGVRMPMAGNMGSMSGGGMDKSGFGKSSPRGTGAATKGKNFRGSF